MCQAPVQAQGTEVTKISVFLEFASEREVPGETVISRDRTLQVPNTCVIVREFRWLHKHSWPVGKPLYPQEYGGGETELGLTEKI